MLWCFFFHWVIDRMVMNLGDLWWILWPSGDGGESMPSACADN